MAHCTLRRQSPEVGAGCGKSARPDLCGGWPVRAIPTVTYLSGRKVVCLVLPPILQIVLDDVRQDAADQAHGARQVEGDRLIREGRWEGWRPTQLLGVELHGRRLGIVGMGRIGQAVARRARAFDMAIHYHNRRRVHPDVEAELEATYHESLDQMLARMDIITIHCPHTPATFHLLSARRLKLLRPHAYVVNTARGEIIDEAALIRLLRNHDIAGAALDVFENEPAISPKLLGLDNVVLLPHMGSATWEGRIGMGESVLINVKTFIDGHTPPNWILPEDVGF